MADYGDLYAQPLQRFRATDIVTERGAIVDARGLGGLVTGAAAPPAVNYVRKFLMVGYSATLGEYKTWVVSSQRDDTATQYAGPGTPLTRIDVLHTWLDVASTTAVLSLPRGRRMFLALDASQEVYDNVGTAGSEPTGSTPSAGGRVRRWNDRLGMRWYEETADAGPLYRPTAMPGGKPALEFVRGSNTRLVCYESLPAWSGPVTLLVVFQLTEALLSNTYGFLYNRGSDVPIWLHNGTAGQSISWTRASGGSSIGFGGLNGAALNLARNTLVWRFLGGSVGDVTRYRATYNGQDMPLTSSFGVATWGQGNIGRSNDSGAPYALSLYLQCLYGWNAALSDEEVQQALAYVG